MRGEVFRLINSKHRTGGEFKFKPTGYTMYAPNNNRNSEREQVMDWRRENNADVINALLLSNKLARVNLCLLKQHACN